MSIFPDNMLRKMNSTKLYNIITALNSPLPDAVKVSIIKNNAPFLSDFKNSGVLQRFVKDPSVLQYVGASPEQVDTKFQQNTQPQQVQFQQVQPEQLQPVQPQQIAPVESVPRPSPPAAVQNI